MQVTLNAVLSVVSTGTCLVVAGVIWQRRDQAGAASLVAFTLAAALWACGNALQGASTSLALKTLSLHVQYVGIAAVPMTWFAFAADYTGQRRWLRPRTLAIIAAPLVLLVLLEWTNGLHGLVRSSTGLVTRDGVVLLAREFGPAFWLGVVYSNLVLGAGTFLLFRALVRTRRVYGLQVLTLIVAGTVPWVANIAYMSGSTTVEPEVFYAVTAIGLAIAVTRYQLFDLTPVARSTVLDELPDPVFVVDHTGRLVDVNAAAAAVTGEDEHTMLGARFRDVLPEHADVIEAAPTEIELDVDGETRYYAPRVSAVTEEADAGQIIVLRDVTSLTRSRQDLERRNAQLEHVADVMSHDLRSPLNVATGRLSLAREKADPAVEAELEPIADAHDRMASIIDSTLRTARASLGETETEPVPLEDACERAWRTVATGDATHRFECDAAVVDADRELLVTLLENLFRNAVEHGQADEIRVSTTADGFVVADDGRGFEDADIERVTELGYTTSEQGTGLGLATVTNIADAHGWTVDVSESDVGGGRFAFGNVEFTRRPSG